MNQDKIVSDAIFGFITLKPYITAIIDTIPFQRQRFMWQLGVTPFVYPTADHSRFEHSIGTYWLAYRLIKKIKQQFVDMVEEERGTMTITDKDVMCVEIAGLCHCIGYGPFSKVWKKKVLPRFQIEIPKEIQFTKIWDILKGSQKIITITREYNLSNDDIQLIDDIINGKQVQGKEILCSIVKNTESGLDVDKWDNCARDATYLGHSTTNFRADIERMIHFAKAIKDDDGKWKLAFRHSESLNIIRVFQLDYYMFETAYRHKRVVAIEQMLIDGIEQCIDNQILSREEIGTLDWILKNNDSVFWSNIGNENLRIFKRIMERRLYTPILEAIKNEIVDDPTTVLMEFLSNNIDKKELQDIRLEFCTFEFGKNGRNPILDINFYKKDEKKIFKFKEECYPKQLNVDYNESRLSVFLIGETEQPEGSIENIKERIKEYLGVIWQYND